MESISRISSLLETGMYIGFHVSIARLWTQFLVARDLTIEAAQSASAARGFSIKPPRNLPFVQLKKLLDSRNDRDVLEGLRRVISVNLLNPRIESLLTKDL